MSTHHPFEEQLKTCLSADRLPFDTSIQSARAKLEQRLLKSNKTPIRITRIKWLKAMRWSVVAAGIATIAFLTFTALEVPFETEIAQSEITLPDGSTISLANNTKGTYNKLTWLFSRKLHIQEGHAFFRVQKGSDFTVHCPKGVVSVLGTSFDIRSEGDLFEVKCKSGKVAVKSINGEIETTLIPGEYISYEKNSWLKSEFQTDLADAWITGLYQFENTPIMDVLAILGEAYTYKIETDGVISPASYSGTFESTQNLAESLEIICKPMGLAYRIDEMNKTILITNI